MRVYASEFPSWAIFLIVLGFFAVVAIVAYIIHRILRFRLKRHASSFWGKRLLSPLRPFSWPGGQTVPRKGTKGWPGR